MSAHDTHCVEFMEHASLSAEHTTLRRAAHLWSLAQIAAVAAKSDHVASTSYPDKK